MSSIRVLVADETPVVRLGLRCALHRLPGIRVVAEAGDARGALDLAAVLRPDVVIVAAELPDLCPDGLRDRLRRRVPDARVLVVGDGQLEAHATPAQVRDAVCALHAGGPTPL